MSIFVFVYNKRYKYTKLASLYSHIGKNVDWSKFKFKNILKFWECSSQTIYNITYHCIIIVIPFFIIIIIMAFQLRRKNLLYSGFFCKGFSTPSKRPIVILFFYYYHH